jgi:hypothetical protein
MITGRLLGGKEWCYNSSKMSVRDMSVDKVTVVQASVDIV